MEPITKGRIQGSLVTTGALGLAMYGAIKLAPNYIVGMAVDKGMDVVRSSVIAPIMDKIPESAAVKDTIVDDKGTSYTLAFDFGEHVNAVDQVGTALTDKMGNGKAANMFKWATSKATESAATLLTYEGMYRDDNPKGLSRGDGLVIGTPGKTLFDVSIDDYAGTAVLQDNITGKRFDSSQYQEGMKGKLFAKVSDYLLRTDKE